MSQVSRLFVTVGALSGAIAVMSGAFGAHALQEVVAPERLATFRTAAQYQLVHALGLVLVGILTDRITSTLLNWSGWLFLVGTLLFSGSLYALVLLDASGLGAITPFGGLAFICAWLLLALAALRNDAGRVD